jgi:CYTH domain-containing protein
MPERWRSSAARELVAAVRKAGGGVERTGTGRIRITGPKGTITIREPAGDTRRDQRREGAAGKIAEATGLVLP